MERVTKAQVVLVIFLMAFFASAEGGRDVPTKKEVDNPQSWKGGDGGGKGGPWGGWGGPWGGWGGHGGGWGAPWGGWGGHGGGWGGHGWFPWFPHFPWGWGGIHEAEDALKYVPKGEKWVGEVPKVDSKAGHGYP